MWQLLSMHKVQGSTPRTSKQRETGEGKGREEESRLNVPRLQTPFLVTGCTVFPWFCSCCILCHEDNRVCVIIRAKSCLGITTGWSW